MKDHAQTQSAEGAEEKTKCGATNVPAIIFFIF